MLVDMFEPVRAAGLSGDPLVDFHQDAVVHLPDGSRATVVSVLNILTSAVWFRWRSPWF